MLLRNQADTEQMLTWSRVSAWEKRNLLSFPKMQLTRQGQTAISLCFHAECPAEKSCTIYQARDTFLFVFVNGVREYLYWGNRDCGSSFLSFSFGSL